MKLWLTRTNDIWHSSEPLESEDTDSRPCLATFDNTLFCFYRSDQDNLCCIKKADNRPWDSSISVTSLHGRDTELSAAPFKDTLFILLRNFLNEPHMVYYKNGEFTWDENSQLPGAFMFQVNLVVYKGKLYYFGAKADSKEVSFCSSTDGRNWSDIIPVNYGGIRITSEVSPQVATYQGLLYLLYREGNNGYNWMMYDGEAWSHPVKLTSVNYNTSPGLVVHNGLLKAIFSDKPTTDGAVDKRIYQYSYDANTWSLPVPSTVLRTSKGVGAASFEGMLYAVYVGTG